MRHSDRRLLMPLFIVAVFGITNVIVSLLTFQVVFLQHESLGLAGVWLRYISFIPYILLAYVFRIPDIARQRRNWFAWFTSLLFLGDTVLRFAVLM